VRAFSVYRVVTQRAVDRRPEDPVTLQTAGPRAMILSDLGGAAEDGLDLAVGPTRPAGTTSLSGSPRITATSPTRPHSQSPPARQPRAEVPASSAPHGRRDHLCSQRSRTGPALRSCRRPGRRSRRGQGRRSGPVTQPVSGRRPRSCGGSKNTVCRSRSWQLLRVTCPCRSPDRPLGLARRCTASSSPAPCPATTDDATGIVQACSRTEKRTPNDHDVIS
jgi:hypothetical protein